MDAGRAYADARLREFAKEARAVFAEAEDGARKALAEYMMEFDEKDQAYRKAVEAGEIAKEDWVRWRKSTLLTGAQYSETVSTVARLAAEAEASAADIMAGKLADIAAENANFAAFDISSQTGLDCAFALQDAGTISVLLAEQGCYVPPPRLDIAKSMRWNSQRIASAITQGVLIGESIPKIAQRVERSVGMGRASATRLARTSTTAAENAGRVASYRLAADMGIKLQKEWVATLDGRTRHSHRQVDGEKVPNEKGSKFSNGCRFPGDPQAHPREVCNCRCTLVAAIDGIDTSDAERWSRLPAGMTYEQWKAGFPKRQSLSLISKHAKERMAERGVTMAEVGNAIEQPLHAFEAAVDSQGRLSQTLVGASATVVINPDTGVIITAYKTGAERRRKYGLDE